MVVKGQKAKSSNMPLHFPLDLVLSRLRVKPLIRFMCVSKEWYNLITSKDFIKEHLNYHTQIISKKYLHIFLSIVTKTESYFEYDLLSIDVSPSLNSFDGSTMTPPIHQRLPSFTSDCVIPIGSCHGLVCLRDEYGCRFSLFNPSTRTRTNFELSDFHDSSKVTCRRFRKEYTDDVYGFGYDNVEDDYKVVKICQYKPTSKVGGFHKQIMVYSSRNKKWNEFSQLMPCTIKDAEVPCNGTLSNNALHWMATSKQGKGSTIVCFNLYTKQLSQISVPQGDSLVSHVDMKEYEMQVDMQLVVFEECLHLVVRTSSRFAEVSKYMIDVWVMEEYGVNDSWRHAGCLKLHGKSFIPVCTSSTSLGNDMMLLATIDKMGFSTIQWGDLTDGVKSSGQHLKLRDDANWWHHQPYVESLVGIEEHALALRDRQRDQGKEKHLSLCLEEEKMKKQDMEAELKQLQEQNVEMQKEIERLKNKLGGTSE